MAFPPIPHAARMGEYLGLAAPFRLTTAFDGPRRLTLVLCALLLLPIGLAIPTATAALEWRNPHYVADAAVLLGRGVPVPEATVALTNCRPGGQRRSPTCDVVITAPRESRTYELSGITARDRPRDVVRVFGRLRARWAWFDIVGNLVFLPLLLAFLTIALTGLGWTALRLGVVGHAFPRVPNGTVQVVDVLTPRWDVAWTDAGGRRRYARLYAPRVPLMVDGLNTVGVAVVQGRRAVPLDASLSVLELTAEQRAHALERAQALQQAGRVRPHLPPVAGEPATQAERLAQVERWADGKRADQAKAYLGAWRLMWDADTPRISERAGQLRSRMAQQLGKRHTDALLQRCRREAAKDFGSAARWWDREVRA